MSRPDFEQLYDTLVAGSYDVDRFGLLGQAHHAALDQARRGVPAAARPPKGFLRTSRALAKILVAALSQTIC